MPPIPKTANRKILNTFYSATQQCQLPGTDQLNSGKGREHTLLVQKHGEPLAHGDAVARPLIVGREARRVRRLGHLAVHDLLEGVAPAGAVGLGEVHEMHGYWRTGWLWWW